MRAKKICSHPLCHELQPCETHQRKPWEGSRRRDNTKLNGWQQQKRAKHVLTKHNTICHVCGQPGGNEADHVVPLAEGGADDESNMRPIHAVPCHRDKTAAEASRSIRANR